MTKHPINQPELAEMVPQASMGEDVILTNDDGEAVAKIVPIGRAGTRRTFGSARGLIHIPEDFDQPLDDFEDYV
jgi:antitoxin (DNA-binding transcriptional repressor) of toxin-antitoxin stability system